MDSRRRNAACTSSTFAKVASACDEEAPPVQVKFPLTRPSVYPIFHGYSFFGVCLYQAMSLFRTQQRTGSIDFAEVASAQEEETPPTQEQFPPFWFSCIYIYQAMPLFIIALSKIQRASHVSTHFP